MKTAIDILTEHFDKNHPHLFYHLENKDDLSGLIDDGDSIFVAITEAMKLYTEQALELAAEKAEIKFIPYDTNLHNHPDWDLDNDGRFFQIDKDSILSLKDQLK